MSSVSTRLETLAETHCVNPLVILEWFLEVADSHCSLPRDLAERAALADIESQLEGRR